MKSTDLQRLYEMYLDARPAIEFSFNPSWANKILMRSEATLALCNIVRESKEEVAAMCAALFRAAYHCAKVENIINGPYEIIALSHLVAEILETTTKAFEVEKVLFRTNFLRKQIKVPGFVSELRP